MDMTRGADLAHRKLADFIWAMDCAPRDRDAMLCQITHTPAEEWPAVKAELCEKGWRAAGGYLIHRRIIASLNEAKLRRLANVNRAGAANKRPALAASEPDAVTGIVQIEARAPSLDSYGAARKARTSVVVDGLLDAPGGELVVSQIFNHALEWSHDNCRVKAGMFNRKALVTELRPYFGRVAYAGARAAWEQAVRATHQAAVDGLATTNIAGYCVQCWRKLLDETLAALSRADATRNEES